MATNESVTGQETWLQYSMLLFLLLILLVPACLPFYYLHVYFSYIRDRRAWFLEHGNRRFKDGQLPEPTGPGSSDVGAHAPDL